MSGISRELSRPAGRVSRFGLPGPVDVTVEPLLRLDPDLGNHLSWERRAAAKRELMAHVVAVPPGPWNPARYLPPGPANLGLLLVAGLVARELRIGETTSAELLAPGDLVKAAGAGDHPQTLSTRVRWSAVAPTRAAILDAGLFAVLRNRFPEVLLAVIERLEVRSQHLGLTQAIGHMTGVDRRLEALFWYMADRCGKVTADGVLVPLQLSHRLLGSLVGARRPTVSTALAGLAARGSLQRHESGWLLPLAADELSTALVA